MKVSDLHHGLPGAISRHSLRQDKEVAAAHSIPMTTDKGESGAMSIQQERQPAPESHTTRLSKIVHDLTGCFFGIRMAAEVLGSLELGDKVTRIVESLHSDCDRGGELAAAVKEFPVGQEQRSDVTDCEL